MSEVEVCDRHIRAFPERAEWYTIQRDKHYAKQQEEIANGNFQHVHEAEIIEFRKQIKVSIRKNEYGRKVKRYRCHECGALLNRQTCKLCEGKIKGIYA